MDTRHSPRTPFAPQIPSTMSAYDSVTSDYLDGLRFGWKASEAVGQGAAGKTAVVAGCRTGGKNLPIELGVAIGSEL